LSTFHDEAQEATGISNLRHAAEEDFGGGAEGVDRRATAVRRSALRARRGGAYSRAWPADRRREEAMEPVPQTDSRTPPRAPRSAGRLVFGLVVLVVGVLLLAGNLGFAVPRRVWSYWPLVLVGLGLVRLLWPGSPDERRSGVGLLVAGIYCSISEWRLFGLHWGSAWPVFLIAAGLSMLLRAPRRRHEASRVP
jgi:hypothetical protein